MLPDGITALYSRPKIIEILRLVAADPESQTEAFPKTEFPPEEIGFLVEHARMMARVLYKYGFIHKEKMEIVVKIDEAFERFEKSEWTIASMYQSANWQSSRNLALMALQTFSVEPTKPNLYWYSISDVQ